MRNTLFASVILGIAVLGGAVDAQQASYTIFGQGANNFTSSWALSAIPLLGVVGLPQIGGTFDVTYSGPNEIWTTQCGAVSCWDLYAEPRLVIGVSNTAWGAVPLPWSPSSGCCSGLTLYVSPDLVVPMPYGPAPQTFASHLSFFIPNNPTLIGLNFYQQWFTYMWELHGGWSGTLSEGYACSNAGHGIIGI